MSVRNNGKGLCGIMSVCPNKAGCLMVLKHGISIPLSDTKRPLSAIPDKRPPFAIPDTPPVIPDVSNRESSVFLAGRFLP